MTTTTFTLEEIQKATSILSSIHANTFLNNLEISVAQAEKEYEEKRALLAEEVEEEKTEDRRIAQRITDLEAQIEAEDDWLKRLNSINVCKYVPRIRFDINEAKSESKMKIKDLQTKLTSTLGTRSARLSRNLYGGYKALVVDAACHKFHTLLRQLALFNYILVRNEGKK